VLSPDGVYECRGWLEDGSSDMEQLAWRLTMTCYLAVLLLLAVVALPFYSGLPSVEPSNVLLYADRVCSGKRNVNV